MTAQYFTVLTDYGTQAFANAIATNQPIQFSSFAVGDGNGQAVTPTADRTALVKETHRANVSAVSLDPRNNKQIIIELTIPEDVGGFYIREMGVFDSTNKLVAYANVPESFKPTLESGSGKVQVLRMILKVSNSQAVTLSIDNSVIFVTRQQLNPKKITSQTTNGFDESGHTHEIEKADTTKAGIVQLTDDTGLDSDKLGLSARAGKKLAQLISMVQLALGNYIPNSKKSNSVTSNSNEDVATSSAAKTAYDKGVEAKTDADNANKNADGRVSKSGDTMTGNLSLKQGDYSGLNVYNNDGYYTRLEGNPHNANSLLTLAYRTPQGTNIAVVSLPKKNGVIAYTGDVVSKSGDSMSGTLSFFGATDSYSIGSYAWRMPIKFSGDTVIGNEKCAIGFNNNGSLHFGGLPGANQFTATLDDEKLWVAGDVKTSNGKSLNTAIQLSDYRSQWGQSGWVKLPNGFIIQWGKTPTVFDEQSAEVVFPVAFPNKLLNIQLTENQMKTVAAHATHLSAENRTLTKFTFKINSTLPISTSADWFAIGY